MKQKSTIIDFFLCYYQKYNAVIKITREYFFYNIILFIVFQRAVLDFAPLCNAWQIETAMMSMRHTDRFVKCLPDKSAYHSITAL